MNYQSKVTILRDILNGWQFSVTREKETQDQIYELIKNEFYNVEKEYKLGRGSVIDFIINGEIGIEVKVKGSKTDILRQCKRYCSYDEIKCLVLITARSMGFPEEINGKPCYYISLTRGML